MNDPIPKLLLPITAPLSWGYERIIRARNTRYDRGKGVGRLHVPVISVGNITTGGVGKSPMVAWIARELLTSGHHPAIAMRGYGATAQQPADEQLEYQMTLPEVPVIANPDRLTASRAFLDQHPHIDRLILDDGFQHRRVHRDLDLVLVDVTQPTFEDRLLPAGLLREPIDALKRADAVIVTRANGVDETLAAKIAYHHGKPPLAWARHRWDGFHCWKSNVEQTCELDNDWLNGKRVLTMLGVGNPNAVIEQIEAHGASVAANIPARDHERYTSAQLIVARGLCEGVQAMVITGKDWVKLREMKQIANWPVPIIVPNLAIDVFAGDEMLRKLIRQVRTDVSTE